MYLMSALQEHYHFTQPNKCKLGFLFSEERASDANVGATIYYIAR